MIVKCKPVYNFQSVEFEMEINNEVDFNLMTERYKKILDMLQSIAPEQAQVKVVGSKPTKPKELMSTDNQQKYLLGLGVSIEESSKMTKKEASEKIKELS